MVKQQLILLLVLILMLVLMLLLHVRRTQLAAGYIDSKLTTCPNIGAGMVGQWSTTAWRHL